MVSRKNTPFESRDVFHGGDHGEHPLFHVTLFHVSLQTPSSVGLLGVSLEFVTLRQRPEFAVRIEGGKYPFHCAMNEILVGQGFAIDVIFARPLQNPGEKFELLIGVTPFVRRAELEELSPEADLGNEGGDEEGIDQTFVHLGDSGARLCTTTLDLSSKRERTVGFVHSGVACNGKIRCEIENYANGGDRFGLGRTQPGRNLFN